MSAQLAVPCAQKPDGTIVFPTNCPRFDRYACIGCNNPVVLKRGKIKTPHFAHKTAHMCNNESVLHKSTKAWIASMATNKNFRITSRCCKCCSSITLFRGSNLINARMEVQIGAYRADVGLFKNGKIFGAIEVKHTHACGQGKLRALKAALFGGCFEVPAIDLVENKFPATFQDIHGYRCSLCVREAIHERILKHQFRLQRAVLKCFKKWEEAVASIKTARFVRYGRRWLLLHRAKASAKFAQAQIKLEARDQFVSCGKALCAEKIKLYEWKSQHIKGEKCNRFVKFYLNDYVEKKNKYYHQRCSPVCLVCEEVITLGKWCACKRERMRPCQDCKSWREKSEMHQFTVPGERQNAFVCAVCAVGCTSCQKLISQDQARYGGKCYTCNRKRKLNDLGVAYKTCACGEVITKYRFDQCYSCYISS